MDREQTCVGTFFSVLCFGLTGASLAALVFGLCSSSEEEVFETSVSRVLFSTFEFDLFALLFCFATSARK